MCGDSDRTCMISFVCVMIVYGPALIEHSLQVAGFPNNARLGHDFKLSQGKGNNILLFFT